MRFFMMVLLVLLLPLRSGLGDAMAMTPHHGTTQQQTQHHSASTVASAAHSHGLEDCAGHGAVHGSADLKHAVEPAQTSTSNDDFTAAAANCDACSACQTCHAVGLVFSRTDLQSLPVPNAQPAALSPAFASAPAARDQKPPIS